MRVLVVGSGAREHAIAWKLRQSPKLTVLFVTPGNAGTASIAENLPVQASDITGICDVAKEHRIDLVIVGPEIPLALGLVDRLTELDIAAFGPTQAASRIESSKAFSKQLLFDNGIPTAAAATFTSRVEARDHVERTTAPMVVKADGLAAGKGVFICESREDALEAIEQMMGNEAIFGASGSTVIVDEFLRGREVSAHAFSDGKTVAPMPFACDYKRAKDGDEGLNTGGIGAFSPALWLDESHESFIHQHITEAVIGAMADLGTPYAGALYPGIIVTDDGPKVLEFNCRIGDPEAQVLLPRLKSDFLEICLAVAERRLADAEIEWDTDAYVGVVMTSGGYPGKYETGFEIAGLNSLEDGVEVFHAGTTLRDDGTIVTSGGRVLTIVAQAASITAARAKAYRNVQRIHFSKAFYRKDIAAPAQDARVD